ncbi:hypothetical protein [Microlunatus sp. Gsoil 973]|uniref:hypothetical protein n=1 Tax=Microlunatus sp. Gsoil 973 TaxID=2672569 RepID=UPI0012B47CB8|nr:hypothetical protein [Microlunatus sp. Gsoil 973]QGN32620.1 hypothetical protein GJV80_07165 [Microlunatus sp. Gsoil 973]
MTNLHVTPADPRDIEWEDSHPVFRVYFWDAQRVSDEYEITGANLTDLLEWTTANAAGRGWQIWLRLIENGRTGAVKLQECDMPPDLGEAITT